MKAKKAEEKVEKVEDLIAFYRAEAAKKADPFEWLLQVAGAWTACANSAGRNRDWWMKKYWRLKQRQKVRYLLLIWSILKRK